MLDKIEIIGARQHNLKSIDVTLPRNKLIVITGLSGSGKSSLAFDTLFAEGQRRYVESLSSYARQFLDQLEKPDVESIRGLSPAIAIEQKTGISNPRSIVATTTEIYDFLRLFYTHVGIAHCPKCRKEVKSQSAEDICEQILSFPEGRKMIIMAPYITGRKGEHKEVFSQIEKDGFVRVQVDGEIYPIEKVPVLDKKVKHTIEAVVDRLKTTGLKKSRLNDSVETALRCGDGKLTILLENHEKDWDIHRICEDMACPSCHLSFGKLESRNFSFNSPYGACSTCHGLGTMHMLDEEKVVPNPKKIVETCVPLWQRGPKRLVNYYKGLIESVGKYADFDLKTPFEELNDKQIDLLFYGTDGKEIPMRFKHAGRWYEGDRPFEGVINNLLRRYNEGESESMRTKVKACMKREKCTSCNGARLRPFSLAVTIDGLSIHQFISMSIEKSLEFIEGLKLTGNAKKIASEILREIRGRLNFLKSVGLHYLSLDRESGSLSGGEAQRIRLATQLGAGLVGVLYILDEPSIGLHQRDNTLLINTLFHLRDLGNTVVVVEHDLETIEKCDYVVDLGPGAGRHGGELCFNGAPSDLRNADTPTALYMTGRMEIPVPEKRHKGNGKFIEIRGATSNNLRNINAKFPLGNFTCVTGVSGSGKSTLVNGILKKAINQHLMIGQEIPGKFKELRGAENVDKMIVIDQSPIGRTPRSNPATYTDAFGIIRELFAGTPEARMRAYKPGRFSFNVKGGRCEACKGDGMKRIEMNFLADVYVECELCKGQRYNSETLTVSYKGRNISQVLDMTVDEAVEFFDAVPRLKRIIGTLQEVGLGYIHLGQAATTLSGGEAQRVKLASELCRMPKGHTLYILDEPTTGLHVADIHKLLEVLLRLRDAGNSVLVIEHNLDVIKVADHIIDLGPEGGSHGGLVIATGTPEQVAKKKGSFTGLYLKELFKK